MSNNTSVEALPAAAQQQPCVVLSAARAAFGGDRTPSSAAASGHPGPGNVSPPAGPVAGAALCGERGGVGSPKLIIRLKSPEGRHQEGVQRSSSPGPTSAAVTERERHPQESMKPCC